MTGLDRPWLTIVGVGADGATGLSARAREAVASASTVYGSARQLQAVADLVRGEPIAWPSPLSKGLDELHARRGQPCCVLATGDPFLYGIGANLASKLEPSEYVCLPAQSSLSLAAARLGWSLQEVSVVSLHGRPLTEVVPWLQGGRRVLLLSWDGRTPSAVAELLVSRGFADCPMHVLENLGAQDEHVRQGAAGTWCGSTAAPLNVIGLDLRCADGEVPLWGCVDDESIEHDGLLTKREIRLLTLQALRPRIGATLWDVGAGSGAIGIEWMLAHSSCRTIAFERDEARSDRIRSNACRLGVPRLEVVEGEAPGALLGRPQPDAIFVGGGSSEELIALCWGALCEGGRLVVNGVTVQTQRLLMRACDRLGGGLLRVSVERARPLGESSVLQPALPILQWSVLKS